MNVLKEMDYLYKDKTYTHVGFQQISEESRPYNRDAKVAGGIKYFASEQNAVLKWI